jgi:hypothetical protein
VCSAGIASSDDGADVEGAGVTVYEAENLRE